ncbi:hypothetical protein ACLOJK_010459 [Asimina triloba]
MTLRDAFGNADTGGAWLSSARAIRCWVKSRNERNPRQRRRYLPKKITDEEERCRDQVLVGGMEKSSLAGRWRNSARDGEDRIRRGDRLQKDPDQTNLHESGAPTSFTFLKDDPCTTQCHPSSADQEYTAKPPSSESMNRESVNDDRDCHIAVPGDHARNQMRAICKT